MSGEATSFQMLRAGASIALVFLIVYFGYDLSSGSNASGSTSALYSIAILAAVGFLLATFTRGFRRSWKLWNLLFSVTLLSILIMISARTHDADPRFIALLLYPLVTASLLNWGWQWQTFLGLLCLALYGCTQVLVPLPGDSIYRWFGVFAAVALAECIALFIDSYRRRIDAHIEQMKQAAAFREAQIAAMAHDIRSPVAAIAGFTDLLEDEDLDEDDRKAILTRIGTTAWAMDLTVSNVLDLYQIAGGRITASPMRVDPNKIVADAASNCAPQAIHKGLKLTVAYGELERGNFDPRHLDRIARNLLAYSIARLSAGEIRLRTISTSAGIAIEVEDDGPVPSDEELATLHDGNRNHRGRPAKTMLGLYVARALAETAGGDVKLTRPTEDRIKVIAEVPSSRIDSKLEPQAS